MMRVHTAIQKKESENFSNLVKMSGHFINTEMEDLT